MYYQEFMPSAILSPFVECLWILEVDQPTPSQERIIPDGSVELIVHYRDCPKEFDPKNNSWVDQGRLLLAGQRKSFLLIKKGAKSGMLGVRFHPAGAAQFLKTPMSDTNNLVLNLRDWNSKCAEGLEDRILSALSKDERLSIMVSFLEERLLSSRPDFIVNEIANLIRQSSGKIDYRKIVAQFDISERQIERRFAQSIGIGPKQLGRTIRFQAVLKELIENPRTSLTDIAASHDFFDQSHFIREFKGFTGLTPKAYLAEAHEMNDFFVSPE